MKTALATGDMDELRPTCPKCGSSNVYFRLTKGFCCRRCGNQFKTQDKKNKDSLHGAGLNDKSNGRGGA
jgi:transposase-like protein